MKYVSIALFAALLMVGCGKSSQTEVNETEAEESADPNQALYDQVMDLHDEVMPKMGDLYKIKSQLQEKIANTPDLVDEKKEAIESVILELDDASKEMMDWMHGFQPLADSVDAEQARAYLESQMEKIKKVKEDMLQAIDKGKQEVDGK